MPFSSTTITTDPYTPNGVTSIFPFYFLALSRDEVQVVLTDADGVETLLTEGFDVVGIGEASGGYVQFTVAPNYAGQSLTIRARPSFAQETDLSNQGPYNPSEINKVLDRLAQKAIYLRDLINSGGVVAPGGITTVTWASVQGKPTAFTPAAHAHAAADVTSGVFDAARIPTLDAAKIGSGTLAAARIPGLDASKITSGTIDASRLPVQSGGLVATDIASLSAPQQALIVEGTLVTIADGSQYRYKGTGSKTSTGSYVLLTTATDWAALTSVPANISAFAALTGAANKIAHFTGAGALSVVDFTATGRALVALASQNAAIAYTSPLTTKGDLYGYGAAPARLGVGSNGQVLTADSTQTLGVKWATPAAGGGSGNDPNFTAVFSGNGDGVTSNDAAFTAAEASAYERIYLPEGRYLTSRNGNQLTKQYIGPGELLISGGTSVLPGVKALTTPITQLIAGGITSEYGESSGQIDFADAQYQYIRPNTRQNIDVNMYFHAGATGVFRRFFSLSGSSGTTAHLTATASAGAVTATLNSVSGLSTSAPNNRIGFMQDDNATPEIVTITGIAGNVITFTPPLANTYTVLGSDYVPTYLSGYAHSPQVSTGRRTNNSHYFLTLDSGAEGAGDTYGFLVRSVNGYAMKPGQTHFFDGATIAPFGGDMQFTADGQYGTPWEHNSLDNGFAVAVINVDTYTRNNAGATYGQAWIHSLIKSEGSQPIDVAFALHGKMRAGLDLSLGDFSSNGERAIQMKIGHRIYFDATASAGAAGIGTPARGFWGNIQGDTYITGFNDGSDAFDIFVGGTRAMRARASSINFPVQVNASANISLSAATQLGLAAGATLRMNGINGDCYFQMVGSNLVLVVGGNVKQTWTP